MKIMIEITTDNTVFEDEGKGPEVARILRHLAGHVWGWSERHFEAAAPGPIDINGHSVGVVVTTESDD